MATFKTDIYNEQDASRVNPSRLLNADKVSGDVQWAAIPYVIDGDEVQGDVIKLGILPAGVIPVPQLSKIDSPLLNPYLLISVGTAADADGWCVDAQTGSDADSFPPGVWRVPTVLAPDTGSGNTEILATITNTMGVDSGGFAGETIMFILAYKLGR